MTEIESGLFLEKNLLKEALNAALRANDMITGSTSDEIRFSSSLHLAAVYYEMRNTQYNEIIAETERFIEKSGAHNLRPNFLAFKSRLQLMDSDKNTAYEWLKNYFVTDTEHLELYKIYQYFTTARAYIVLGQTSKASNYVFKLKQLGTDFNRPLDIAEASVLQAVLEWAVGKKKESESTLEKVLDDIQHYGFINVVSIEGAAVLPILKRIYSRIKKENYEGPLKVHYLHEIILAAYEQSKLHKGIAVNINENETVRLSKQQKLIISFLSEGYKNAEIAEMAGITIHTVKSHCAAAYEKLGVNNSMDAVLRARELKIIE